MKLNPQQAPLYGGCVLTVQLNDDDVRSAEEEDKDEEFYLLLSGSTQRHVTSTLRVSNTILQAVCPAHNVCEQVLVTLCLARPDGPVDTHLQQTSFLFVQDLALNMAHLLLDSPAAQEALLDDEQIWLKDCGRLDESLARALKHLSLPHNRTVAGGQSHRDVDRLDNRTHTITATDSHRHDTETHQEPLMEVSSLQDCCPVSSQLQQLSRLLLLAATYGLKTVASFVLQQPEGKEALRMMNIQGQTPAGRAESRGHQQLVELFTQYETWSDVPVETKEKLHFYPEGRVFQHHADLGTYTLMFPGFLRKEGAEDCLREEVDELRRLIQLHRDTKEKSDSAQTRVSINQKSDPGLAVVTIEHSSTTTTTEEQGSTPSLEEREQGEDPAAVTHTTCTSRRPCRSQEAGREQKGSAAARSPAARTKKNKKKATKTPRPAAESAGSNRSTPKATRRTAPWPTKTTGSGTVSPREQTAASTIADRGAEEHPCCPTSQETRSAPGPGGDGKSAGRKAAALPVTSIAAKQEGQKWEVERMVGTGTKTQRDKQCLPAKDIEKPAAQRTVTMGQDQSQESQSDPEEPNQPDSMNKSHLVPKSPDVESKHRRVLWRDGGWIGSMGSSPHGPETAGKTVWYEGDGFDQGANEASNRKDVNSQSVWYDSDSVAERRHEQLEQRECDLSSAQASALSPPQLTEDLSSHQLSAGLSQPHAAGPQPAPSQRQEVHGSQQEEEVRSDWKEEGVAGREEVSYSRQSSGTVDVEEGGEDKPKTSEEKVAKGRRKRRKKRGRRGDAEARLCSSSSTEGQAETRRERATNFSSQPETESAAEDKTGRTDLQPPAAPQPTWREEADKDAVHLHSQPEVQTWDAHGTDANISTPELSHTDSMRTDLTEVTASQTIQTKELSENESTNSYQPDPDSTAMSSELSEKDIRKIDVEETVQLKTTEVLDPAELESKGPASLSQTLDDVESKVLPENEDLTVAGEATMSMKELPVKHSDPTELTEDSFLVEFPQQNTLQSEDSNKPAPSVDPEGRPGGVLEAAGLPLEGRADVSSPQIQEGSAEATALEFLDHCSVSEMLRDQQHKEEKRNELWVSEEEVCQKRSRERKREEEDRGTVPGRRLCSMDAGKRVEDEEFPSLDGEKEQSYEEDLVAAAVAVVVVAIASAVASIELSQPSVDSQSESQGSARREAAGGSLSAQDSNTAAETLNQLEDNFLNTVQTTQLTAQPTNKDNCQLLAVAAAETVNTPILQSHIKLTSQISSKEQPDVEPSEESDCVELQSSAEAEKLPAAQLSHTDQANLQLLQEIQMKTTPTKLFTRSLPEEDSLLDVCTKPLPAEVDGHGQTDMLLHRHSHLPGPGVHTGQNPEASHTSSLDPVSEEILTLVELRHPDQVDEQQLDSHFQQSETHDRCGGGSVDFTAAESEMEGQAGGSESSDCQVEQPESRPPLVTTPREGESPTLTLSCSSTLQVTSSDSANPPAEEPAAPVNMSSWSSDSMKFVTAIPLDAGSSPHYRRGQECVAVDNEDSLDKGSDIPDLLDGWKETEWNTTKRDVEEEMVGVEDTQQNEAEASPAAEDEDGGLDSTDVLQIQRESDVFYPVQSNLDHSTVAPCTDVHPNRGECVSVCLLHRDEEGLKVGAELGDGAFKKPEDRPPCVGQRSEQICVSWTSTASEGSDTVTPQSSRRSWRSETEHRGGGETEGAGDEEEKKDHLPENPVSSAILRASVRSLSPFRRHSWELGRNNTAAHADITQRSSLHYPLSGEVKRAKPPLHRRSMSWCPSNLHCPDQEQIDSRSHSLEGLEVGPAVVPTQSPSLSDQEEAAGRSSRLDSQERGSLVSLTEEELEGDGSSIGSQASHQVLSMTTSCPEMFHQQILTKSVSMVTISHRDTDGVSSSSSASRSLGYSISEEEPGPLRSDTEVKGGPKISRTFSYLRSKMSKKGKEKDKERKGDREKQSGHLFIPISPPASTACQHCSKLLLNRETFLCNNCGVHVHKSCTESLSICAKSKTKQVPVPEAVPGSAVTMRSKSASSASSLSSTSSSSSRERWSTATTPDDQLPVMFPRRHPSIFNPHSNLAKSISTSNIAGLDDVSLKGIKFLSQSTDSLHQGGKVNASTESLTDEGTEMIDSQLMAEFECDIRDLEADSWSGLVDKKFLKTLKKDEIKRQDVIYELYQTEVHHMRTLKIMSEVYLKGLQKELQLDTETLDKIFPVLDELLEIHTHFLTLLLENRRAASADGQNTNSFLICRIGGVLVNQFSGCSSDHMKKVYGKFCSRHNEAVHLYKDLYAKDKRFQAFIKRIMSSSIVRRLSVPECILLVTQRITKYPVLIQRILQHTKDSDEDHSCVSEALRCVKELIMAVDRKVNEQEKKRRLREVYSRTDSKSIMRMKSGQMFAKEDLVRGRKLLHDGVLQLKNSAGRLKDVHAMLLSDVLVFLQEKDQKYIFASLDQRSTVISLQNLIVREVANEERGLFLITAGTERPEMVEVLASSKEERNTWRAIIQEAMHCMEKDEDEGVPSETEEDRRQQESRAKEIRELLRKKDEKIISLLEEKVHIFRELGDCSPGSDDTDPQVRQQMLFRATPDDVTKGEPIINDALREVETLHALVSRGVGGTDCNAPVGLKGGSVGPVCLPRRAETFGGFDSHQMNNSKNGDKDEGDESLDLRRTESDGVLKKGATASLQMLLKRNNEQVQHSVTHLHDLLISLQAVVLQQDSFIEDQRQALNNRLTINSSRHSSSSSLSSSSSSRPSSLIEQEKHRSLDRQRQDAASLQKQQAAHLEEKKKREKEWELKEKGLAEQEERLREEEKETRRRRQELMEETSMLQKKKEEYHRELERMREAQRRLERDQEALKRDIERLDMRRDQSEQLQRYQQTPFSTSEDSLRLHRSGSLDLDSKEAAEQPKEVELSSSVPTKESFLRIGSKRMTKNFNLFSSTSSSKPQGAEKESQLPSRLLQLAKPKEKKDKKRKKGKGGEATETENNVTVMLEPQNEGDIFFC